MNLEVANRLQQLRKAKGLSQEELANILGLSRQAISKWERAETSPDTDNLICLARLYNISIDKLLDTSESTEEIKERIAQERIDEIKNGREDNIPEDNDPIYEDIEQESNNDINNTYSNFFKDNNDEIVIKKAPKIELTEEEKKLKKENDNKSGSVMLCLVGLGIIAYVVIGNVYKDWTIGWEFIPVGLFGWSIFNGIFSERQFSILSFFFVLFFEMLGIRDLLILGDSLDTAYIVLLYIIFVTLIIYSTVAMIFLMRHILKNRKETEIIYFKERINEINANHFKEFEKLTKKNK